MTQTPSAHTPAQEQARAQFIVPAQHPMVTVLGSGDSLLRVIEKAFDRIEVGGLMVNDVSTYRIDHMPYGGVKSSGFGREGLRYAIEEMTELKLLTINTRPGA